MSLTDEEIELIRTTISKIETVQNKYHAKVSEIHELVSGFRELLRSSPKNIDCTLMTDEQVQTCLLYTSPSPRDRQKSRMPSSA